MASLRKKTGSEDKRNEKLKELIGAIQDYIAELKSGEVTPPKRPDDAGKGEETGPGKK